MFRGPKFRNNQLNQYHPALKLLNSLSSRESFLKREVFHIRLWAELRTALRAEELVGGASRRMRNRPLADWFFKWGLRPDMPVRIAPCSLRSKGGSSPCSPCGLARGSGPGFAAFDSSAARDASCMCRVGTRNGRLVLIEQGTGPRRREAGRPPLYRQALHERRGRKKEAWRGGL